MIRLVRAIHDENFVINFQKNFRDVLDEKEMSNASFDIFLHRIRSVFLFQLTNQSLNRSKKSQRFASKFRFQVINISRFKQRINY
jgi:hypothetical protein